MINLWALGAVFLYINFMIGILIIGDALGAKLTQAVDKTKRGERPLFILPIAGVAIVLLNMSLIITFLSPSVPGLSDYLGLTKILEYPFWVDWFGWSVGRTIGGLVSFIVPSVSVSLFGILYVWLIRSILPEKYKPCIPWLKPEGE